MSIVIIGNSCNEVLTIGESQGVQLEAIVSNSSLPISFPPCCVECATPIIDSNLYEGQTLIPFSLDMPDGTTVNELTLGGQGTVFNGVGTIELATPLVAGTVIQLQVNDASCKAVSCKVTVKMQEDDCNSCGTKQPCHIRVLDVKLASSGTNGVITQLITSDTSGGALKYRLNGGEWFDDWNDIGFFPLGSANTLGIKSKDNPSCKITYPIITVVQIVNTICPPTPTPVTPSPVTPTPVTPTPVTPTPVTPTPVTPTPVGSGCPTFNSISGNSTPATGTIEGYSLSVAGGSGYSLVWSTSDGSPIVSGQSGQFPSVQWNNSGNQELRLAIYGSGNVLCSYHVFNVNVGGSTPTPVTPTPVTPTPVTPSPSGCVCPSSVVISGNTNVSQNTSHSYSVTINGGSNYTHVWSVIGGNITSGQGTTNVTVDWTTAGTQSITFGAWCGGTLCATDTDLVFVSGTPTPVTPTPVTPTPVTPSPVTPSTCVCPTSVSTPSGNANPMQNTSETYTASITGGSGYTILWTATGGTISGANNGTSATVNWGNAGSGNVSYGVYCNGTLCSGGIGLLLVTIGISPTPVTPTPVTPTPVTPTPVTTYYNIQNCNTNAIVQTTTVLTNSGQQVLDTSSVKYTWLGTTTTTPTTNIGAVTVVSGVFGCA